MNHTENGMTVLISDFLNLYVIHSTPFNIGLKARYQRSAGAGYLAEFGIKVAALPSRLARCLLRCATSLPERISAEPYFGPHRYLSWADNGFLTGIDWQ